MRFLLVLFLWMCAADARKQVRLITFTTGSANPSNGYEAASAAVDVALSRAAATFPHVVQNLRRSEYFAKGAFTTCIDSDAYTVSGLHVLLGGNTSHAKASEEEITVVIAPGCSFEIVDLGDFAREADAVVIASTASVAVLKNKKRFPTTLAMAATSFADAAQGMFQFLMQNRWSRINLLCEKVDANPSRAGALDILLGIFVRTLQAQQANVNFVLRPFNLANIPSVRRSLLESKNFSTVNLLVTTCPDFKTLLDVADGLNMTTGEYVFLIICQNGFSDRHQDALGKMRLPASLNFAFVASFGDIDWSTIDDDMDLINNVSAVRYGYEVPEDTEMLNETWDILDNLTGKSLTSRFFGRTFQLPSRAVTVGYDGTRVCDILFKQFHPHRRAFETVFVYYSVARVILPFGNTSVIWSKLSFPSSFAPLCGFQNERCQSTGSNLIYLFFLTLLAVVALLLAVRKLRTRTVFSWSLPPSDVAYKAAHLHVSKSITKLSFKPRSAISTRKQGHWLYKEQTVTSHEIHSGVAFVDLVRHGPAVFLLDSMCKMDNPNISKFFGLYWISLDPTTLQAPYRILALSERGEKGSLDDLLRHDDIALSWELRFAIIADILSGLGYIHRSALRYHDALSSVCITITKRYGILIGDTALDRLRKVLRGNSDPDSGMKDLWKSPEQILYGVPVANAAAGHVYSLGAILYEIATRKIPVLPKAAEHDPGTEVLLIWTDNEDNDIRESIPEEIVSLVQQCCAPIPQQRPTLPEILRRLGPVLPSQRWSLIDRLAARLTRYNEELEDTVRERNQELLGEMERVDDVLSELLPREVIQRLRKSEVIEPEYFGSVSVLFSGVPAFDAIVNSSAPLTVVCILHDLYSAIDKLLGRYDAYKVETIKDTYMIASGLPVVTGANHAVELAELAVEMMTRTVMLNEKYGIKGRPAMDMRIGIHSGPCVAGVIGLKLPHYLLFGDTVNTASRMETTGLASKIQISSSTRSLVLPRNTFDLIPRGLIDIKGKGNVETFWLSK